MIKNRLMKINCNKIKFNKKKEGFLIQIYFFKRWGFTKRAFEKI